MLYTKQHSHATNGFTIVELLIVIVVIAILSAIVIVSYANVRNNAADSAVKSDLAQLKQQAELYNQYNTHYPATSGVLPSLGFKATKSAYAITPVTSYNLVWCWWDSDPTKFAVAALSTSGNVFVISDASGSVTQYSGSWQPDQNSMCTALGVPTGTNNFRGYAATDTTTGPWRAWVGGN